MADQNDICGQCGKYFANLKAFQKHDKLFHEENLNECGVCSQTFDTRMQYQNHKHECSLEWQWHIK